MKGEINETQNVEKMKTGSYEKPRVFEKSDHKESLIIMSTTLGVNLVCEKNRKKKKTIEK